MRFLQASDFHLDRMIGAGRLGLSRSLRDQLKQDVRAAVASALQLALERDCGVVLLPGDLFDDETSTVDTLGFLKEQLDSLAPKPVIITPGNHDYLSPASPYAQNGDGSSDSWPGNVHIFRSPRFVVQDFPDLDLSVTGIAHTHRGEVRERLLAEDIPLGQASLRVLVCHGSREFAGAPSKEKTLPFTDEELLSHPFHYAAIGHYHSRCVITDQEGHPRAAYAGCPQGFGLDEAGVKSAILGEISPDGSVVLEPIRTCVRIIHTLEVDVTRAEHRGQIESRVVTALEKQDPRPDTQDIVHITLTGLLKSGVEVPAETAFEGRYAHVGLENVARPDYDLDRYRRQTEAATVASRFVRALDERVAAATSKREKQILTNAVYYGLDALSALDIEPRYESHED